VLLLLACALPALCQTDLEGNPVATQVRTGFDGSTFSDGRTSSVGTVDVMHRYSRLIALEGLANGGQYFGDSFAGGGMFLTVNPNRTSYITGGGLYNSHTDTTQAWAVSIEGGSLIHKWNGFLKAIEADYNQTWKSIATQPARTTVTLYSPRFVLYLPKDWELMVQAGAIDVASNGLHNFTPSGGGRLRIPVSQRLEFTASAGFDSEGITNVQQLESLSTRTYGGGVRYWATRTLSVGASGSASFYSVNHLSSTTYGISVIQRFPEKQ
jgi:hypothetical protein